MFVSVVFLKRFTNQQIRFGTVTCKSLQESLQMKERSEKIFLLSASPYTLSLLLSRLKP